MEDTVTEHSVIRGTVSRGTADQGAMKDGPAGRAAAVGERGRHDLVRAAPRGGG